MRDFFADINWERWSETLWTHGLRILVTAAAARCPETLFDQLGEGGVLVIPLGGRDYQTLQAIRKVRGLPQTERLSACRFVPLVGVHGWPA